MKILVTGGTGFVGSHAIPELLAAGHGVRLLARSREKVEAVLGGRSLDVSDVVVGDMGDPAAVKRALEGCDAVLHAAAAVEIARGAEVVERNAAGLENVVGGAVAAGLDPVVCVSSIVALAPRGGRMTVDDPVSTPATGYARSKADGERRARALQAEGAPLVLVYPSAIYGPDDPGLGQVFKGLRDRLRYGWPVTTGGSSCVDVRDLARILAAVMEPGRGPRRYMAGGGFLTWAEEADLVEGLVGRRVRRVPAPPVVLRAVGHVVEALQRLVPSFDYPLTHEAAVLLTEAVPCDSDATVRELGLGFRPVEETLRDSIAWLVRAGHLEARWAPKLAPGAPHAP